jgi:hypothetical protein
VAINFCFRSSARENFLADSSVVIKMGRTVLRLSQQLLLGVAVPVSTLLSRTVFDFVVKAIPLHATKALGGEEYSSYSFSTSALDGGEWSASYPSRALASGKGPPVPILQEAGRAPEPVWTQRIEENSFRLCRGSNLDRPVVHSVARHYTVWATRLTIS